VSLLSHFQSHFAATGATGAQLRDTIEIPRATFYRALSDLVEQGKLINTGTKARPFYQLPSP
jgi:DNA-binding IclR family transcriptional regulator